MNVSDLRQLELKNIGSWPSPAKAVAIGLVCLLVLAGGWYVDLQDQTTLLEQVEQKELALKQDLESKQAKVVNLDALTAQLEDIKQSFGDMLKRLPNKTEVAGLLVDISQQGLGAGLEFELQVRSVRRVGIAVHGDRLVQRRRLGGADAEVQRGVATGQAAARADPQATRLEDPDGGRHGAGRG